MITACGNDGKYGTINNPADQLSVIARCWWYKSTIFNCKFLITWYDNMGIT